MFDCRRSADLRHRDAKSCDDHMIVEGEGAVLGVNVTNGDPVASLCDSDVLLSNIFLLV